MRYFFYLVLICTFSLSKENVQIFSNKKIYVKSLETEFFGFKSPNTNFYTLATTINANNLHKQSKSFLNTSTDDERTFQILLKTYNGILKDYNIENNVGVGVTLTTNNNLEPIYGNMVLFLDKKSIQKIKNRTFDDKEYDLITKGDYILPLYPLRELFKNAKIYNTKLTKNGLLMKYSKEKTTAFYKYLKKHVFDSYYTEIKLQEIYHEYLQLSKDKIYGCIIQNNFNCVQKYIKYKFDINKKDNEHYQTPLMYAVANGHYELTKLLIDNGANPNIFPEGMENAYLAAKRLGFTKIVNLLEPISKLKTRNKSSSTINYSSKDLKNLCLGGNFCYDIGSTDIKNVCLGITDYKSLCYNIQEEDLKNLCLAKSAYKFDSLCYEIENEDLKNTCLGITKFPSLCYEIKNNNLKSMCLGISRDSNNCYNID